MKRELLDHQPNVPLASKQKIKLLQEIVLNKSQILTLPEKMIQISLPFSQRIQQKGSINEDNFLKILSIVFTQDKQNLLGEEPC